MSKRLIISALTICLCLTISGCAEFRNRGGTVDWLEDRVLFKADTKSLRLIRSYIIVGGLARLATSSPMAADERAEFSRRMYSALGHAYEAYSCMRRETLPPAGTTINEACSFFDDRMSLLDAATLRLARSVFLPKENVDLLSAIQKEALGTDLIDDVFGTAGKVLDAATAATSTVAKQVNLGNSILKLGRRGFQTGTRLGPIYRDAIELEMRILMATIESEKKRALVCDSTSCDSDLTRVKNAFREGAGEMRDWVVEIRDLFEKYRFVMTPTDLHFAEVSELIWRACENLVSEPESLANCKAYKESAPAFNRLLFANTVKVWRAKPNGVPTYTGDVVTR